MMNCTAIEDQVDSNADSDDHLTRLALAGDAKGFECLIEKYKDRLFRAMLRDVGCPHFAEDIVQESFVNAFKRLDTFKQRSQFYTWLFRIALNVRHTQIRKNSRVLLLADDNFPLNSRIDHRDSPSATMQRKENCQAVREAMNRIEEKHRLILVLREYENFDYEKISKVMGIELGTVRSRLHRARKRLRCELKRKMPGSVSCR